MSGEPLMLFRILKFACPLMLILALVGCATTGSAKKPVVEEDPYAKYVWPPPPDEARIQLEDIVRGRPDAEAKFRLDRALFGATPQSPYDWLVKPFGAEYDPDGRLLVTDTVLSALIRFDKNDRRMDVFGTRGAVRLDTPLGLCVGSDGTSYVADAGLGKVVAFDPQGEVTMIYGRKGELDNPTDAALSPDGSRLYVADSKSHRIVIFSTDTAETLTSFGKRGEGDDEFNFPTSLTFGPEGNLFVVDQLNSRVVVFTEEGQYLDQFGSLGVGFGSFVRPKDIAVDPFGLIYVTDAAFNNLQIFDIDFTLLTFVGSGGTGPGQFNIAAGVAVRGDRFAVVDQLNRRVQTFRFLESRQAEQP
jgi:DNA-binding beta-propeller fold protein YncE